MSGLFRGLIEERRSAPGDDLLSLLIAARDADDRLSEDELVATAMLLLFAGHETTTNLLSNSTLMLLRNPEARDRFVSEPESAGTAIEEFLRFDGPSNSMSRVVRTAHEIGGKQLREGDRVFAMIFRDRSSEKSIVPSAASAPSSPIVPAALIAKSPAATANSSSPKRLNLRTPTPTCSA